MQPVELTEAEQIAAAIVASSLYALVMMFSLVFIAEIQPFSRVLKLTYFTSLAAIDFYSDLLYIFTQTFANPFLFVAAIFIAFAPTIVYMTATAVLVLLLPDDPGEHQSRRGRVGDCLLRQSAMG